jgi:hypothetical protein
MERGFGTAGAKSLSGRRCGRHHRFDRRPGFTPANSTPRMPCRQFPICRWPRRSRRRPTCVGPQLRRHPGPRRTTMGPGYPSAVRGSAEWEQLRHWRHSARPAAVERASRNLSEAGRLESAEAIRLPTTRTGVLGDIRFLTGGRVVSSDDALRRPGTRLQREA